MNKRQIRWIIALMSSAAQDQDHRAAGLLDFCDIHLKAAIRPDGQPGHEFIDRIERAGCRRAAKDFSISIRRPSAT